MECENADGTADTITRQLHQPGDPLRHDAFGVELSNRETIPRAAVTLVETSRSLQSLTDGRTEEGLIDLDLSEVLASIRAQALALSTVGDPQSEGDIMELNGRGASLIADIIAAVRVTAAAYGEGIDDLTDDDIAAALEHGTRSFTEATLLLRTLFAHASNLANYQLTDFILSMR